MGTEQGAETVGDVLSAFRGWLQARAGLGDIAVLGPGEAHALDGIGLVIQRLEHGERRHGDTGNPIIEAVLLLLVGGADPLAAATRDGELLFALHDERWTDGAGMTRPLRVEAGEAAEAARVALGLPPMLALLLRLPIERRLRRAAVRPVLHPLHVELADLSALEGVVLGKVEGSEPQPLAQARVEAPDYGRSGVTDHRGRFRIDGLPAEGAVALTIAARQATHTATTKARSGVVLTLPIAAASETPKGQ